MTIKSKISYLISIVFTVFFSLICVFIITVFSNFRKEEFKDRLREKALTSIKLLIDVIEVDNELLKIIDQNSINELYDEKTLIFDANYKLIYSSLDDTKIDWNVDDLNFLKKNKTFFKKDGNKEIYGVYYDGKKEDYFALISANDNYGKRKLYFLTYLIIGSGILFILGTWFFTFFIIKVQLNPLDVFHKKIQNINDLNSEAILQTNTKSNNEIDLISKEFNFMMSRITDAYLKQKEFTSQASHEIRTPLARISVQLENQIKESDEKEKLFLTNIFKDINQLNRLINSLLILSKTEIKQHYKTEITRVDEAIYASVANVKKEFPTFRVNFKIDAVDGLENFLEVNCNQSLLEICFENLCRNAYLYADNEMVNIQVSVKNEKLKVSFINSGQVLSNQEQKKIFSPFMRGENAKNKNGLGLGLRIVHRILTVYGFNIKYKTGENLNIFILYF